MTQDSIAKAPDKAVSREPVDERQRLLVLTLELARRLLDAETLDDVFYLLTNDIRTVIEFDRSFFLAHLGGRSGLVAANNQAMLEKKARFFQELNTLAGRIYRLASPLFISDRAGLEDLPEDKVPPDLKEALQVYLDFSACKGLLLIPLNLRGQTLGHLLFEYLGEEFPRQVNVISVLNAAPFFASALAQKWLQETRPAVMDLTLPAKRRGSRLFRFIRSYGPVFLVAALFLYCLLYLVPMDHEVGGEAQVVPLYRHMAFCQMDGLVARINVTEGSPVRQGDVVASLDDRELEFKILTTQRDLNAVAQEALLLRKSFAQDIAKLAESQLAELRKKSLAAELDYLQWQRQFLNIRAPVSGVVLTKDVETLVGKKFAAGEPFCEIAVPGELLAEILVPEERIASVKAGQKAELYLNNDPLTGYKLTVKEVAPKADVVPRLGSVYRVKALFADNKAPVKVGMKGIGKIHVREANLWTILSQRLATRWNQLSLYF